MLSPKRLKVPKLYNLEISQKCKTFSPYINNINYTSYKKEKSFSNFFKSKKQNNIKTINSKYFIRNNSNFSKQYNTINNTSKKLRFFNSILKNNKSKKNKVKNILLTSLFNLPHIKSYKNIRNKTDSKFKNNFEKIRINDSHQNNCEKKNINGEIEGINLEDYLKDKFYEDIDKKMTIKFKFKNFFHDNSVKERIIKMKKIGLFWGSIFEYCNPILSAKKFKYSKKFYQKRKNLKKNDMYIEEYKSKTNKEIKPILYTHNLYNTLMRNQKNKKSLSINKNEVDFI